LQLAQYIKLEKLPKIIILDIPRVSLNYINYAVIEKLKNGLIYCGKYEGRKCRFHIPHIIIIANKKPKIDSLLKDRWYIKNLGPKDE
jgi:hypothetical protein